MPENNTPNMQTPEENNGTSPAFNENDLAGIPTTPIAPPNTVYPGEDISGIPTTPIAPPNTVYPGPSTPSIPSIPSIPSRPTIPSVPSFPSGTYFGQVRFLNASTNGLSLDAYIDGRNVFSGSSFATVSTYQQVSDGFHTITIRQTNGPILYQQTIAFISGERVTMVILDAAGGVTLSKVSDMGCTNVPSGYGCFRVANMSYQGSNYDIRTFNNQIIFGGVGYKEVTSYKQISSGNYTFFVTNSQTSFTSFNEIPVIVLTAFLGVCPSCTVANPLLSFNLDVTARRAYTSYIIGNPWSNLYQVFTLEDR